MDKKQYYRLLGIREGATQEQIKAAYEKKMRKLRLPDYADDPEYAARKMTEIKNAYCILSGHAEAPTKAQKDAFFEKVKDALDGGEDAMKKAKSEFKSKAGHTVYREKATRDEPVFNRNSDLNDGVEKLKKTVVKLGRNVEREAKSHGVNFDVKSAKKNPLKLIITAFVFFSIMSSVVSACVSSFDSFGGNGYGAQYEEIRSANKEQIQERVGELQTVCGNYSYYDHLDMTMQEHYLDRVEWDYYAVEGSMWADMYDLRRALGLEDAAEAVNFIMSDDEYYWKCQDTENAVVLATLMAPPPFEEIAGSLNLYNNEVILDYDGYYRFLIAVAEEQTEMLLSGGFPAEDY